MRQIKFRAWDKDSKKMFKIARFDFSDYTIYSHLFACDGYLGEGCEIMQYTGLKDKNGVEIFEGDLVRFTNGIDEIDNGVGKVVWEQSECNFVIQYKTTNRVTQEKNGTTKTIYLISNEIYQGDVEYEVIGNIYENSYLLEEQK